MPNANPLDTVRRALEAIRDSMPQIAQPEGFYTRWIDDPQRAKLTEAIDMLATLESQPSPEGGEFTVDDFRKDLIRIDFREHDVNDIRKLQKICEAINPGRYPAYTFGKAYFCHNGNWYEGGTHNLVGNKFTVVKVSQIATESRMQSLLADNARLREALTRAVKLLENEWLPSDDIDYEKRKAKTLEPIQQALKDGAK